MTLILNSAKPRDLRADVAEFVEKVGVSALNVMELGDRCRPFGAKPRDEHGGARAQIGCGDLRSDQTVIPAKGRAPSVDRDRRAHAAKFGSITKTVVPNTFANATAARSKAKQGRELGLHIGRKSRVGERLNFGSAERFFARCGNAVGFDLYGNAHSGQSVDDRVKMLWDDQANAQLPARSRNCREICPRFDHIGNHAIAATVQSFYSANANAGSSRTVDLRAARVEIRFCVNVLRAISE